MEETTRMREVDAIARKERCGDCYFFVQNETQRLTSSGSCHYDAPVVVHKNNFFATTFPVVNDDEFCGSFEQRKN